GRAGARAKQLDDNGAKHGCRQRDEHRRHVEQNTGRHACKRDVPEPVSHQRLPALDEEEADGGSEHADDGADTERESHELELEQARWAWDGACHRPGSFHGGPSNAIPPRTSNRRSTTCSTAPNSCET